MDSVVLVGRPTQPWKKRPADKYDVRTTPKRDLMEREEVWVGGVLLASD